MPWASEKIPSFSHLAACLLMICFIRTTHGSSVCIVRSEIRRLLCVDVDIVEERALLWAITRRAGDIIESAFAFDVQKEDIITMIVVMRKVNCMIMISQLFYPSFGSAYAPSSSRSNSFMAMNEQGGPLSLVSVLFLREPHSRFCGFVRCLMRDGEGQKSRHDDAIKLIPPISRRMVGITPWHVATSF